MFLKFFLMLYMIDAKIIKNINVPSCRNCIYYKPSYYNDFSSTINKCEYFGTKDIHTNIINYDYADLCRADENKCGLDGKYFIEEKNIESKIFLHNIKKQSPLVLLFLIIILSYSFEP